MRALWCFGLLAACGPTAEGPRVVFDPAGGFYDAPWPSDARRTADGALAWSYFPNASSLPQVDSYLAVGERLIGAPLNAPVYLRFEADPDLDLLPAVEGTLHRDSPVQLVDVDPRSPTFGERIPWRWEYLATPGTWHPGKILAIAPFPGATLRPRTTYALLVTTALGSADPRFTQAFRDGEGAWSTELSPLREALPVLRLRPAEIAAATVFTTGDPTAELETIARYLRSHVDTPDALPPLESVATFSPFTVYRTDYRTPNFMTGDKPYSSAGGAFRFSEDDGRPEIIEWEGMRLSVVTPADLSAAPPDGWPVLVSLHGTGGDYRTFANSSNEFEIATWMAEGGAVGLSIDLPLHGNRGTDDTIIDIHSFNVLQPDSALHIHRQAAIDLLYLLQMLTERDQFTVTLPDGSDLLLDTRRLSVIGHSQGGITGALALPWIGDMADGVMLSGAGGLLAITAVERDNDYDIPTLIRNLLAFADDEPLTELHPVLGLVQSLVDPTDPINYAPYWFAEDDGLTGATPTPVLVTSGLRDDMTPYRTAEAMACAARMPFLNEQFTSSPCATLRGLSPVRMPATTTTTDWNGAPIAAGIAQYNDGTHFVIFEQANARNLARNFVLSTLQGEPELRLGAPPEPTAP